MGVGDLGPGLFLMSSGNPQVSQQCPFLASATFVHQTTASRAQIRVQQVQHKLKASASENTLQEVTKGSGLWSFRSASPNLNFNTL